MANLVAVLATTHHPFFYRASTTPPESRPDFADEWVRKVKAYRETLTRVKSDVLVMVGSDHFNDAHALYRLVRAYSRWNPSASTLGTSSTGRCPTRTSPRNEGQ